MVERYYLAHVVIDMATKYKYDEDIHTVTFYLKHDGELTDNQLLSEIRRNRTYRNAKSIDVQGIAEVSLADYESRIAKHS